MSGAVQELLQQTYIDLYQGPGSNFDLQRQEVASLVELSMQQWGGDTKEARQNILDDLGIHIDHTVRVHGWNPTVSFLRGYIDRERAMLVGLSAENADIYALTQESQRLVALESQMDSPEATELKTYFLLEIERMSSQAQ